MTARSKMMEKIRGRNQKIRAEFSRTEFKNRNYDFDPSDYKSIFAFFQECKFDAARSPVFYHTLSRLGSPINILQIGAIEELKKEWFYGSGWSELYFAEHVSHGGGSLTICDTNANHLAKSEFVLFNFPDIKKRFVHGKGEDNIAGDYDLIYLDGSNEEESTRTQFEQIDLSKSAVLIDDAHIKAPTLVREYPFEMWSTLNNVIFLDMRKKD